MINEDYCSYEVAKLLKEKGFDTFKSYGWDEQLFDKEHPRNFSIGFDNKEHWISCPTQSMAMKWLREVHNIQIELNWDKGNQLYSFQIWKLGKYQPEISSLDLWRIYKDDNYLGEWNYEDAVEAALKYCLGKIKLI